MEKTGRSDFNRRLQRLDSMVREEVTRALLEECDLPQDALISITRVKTSVDVAHATVYISVLPEEKEKEVLERLEEQIYDIQQCINKRLYLKIVPKIMFRSDKSETHAARIDELIEQEHERKQADNSKNENSTE